MTSVLLVDDDIVTRERLTMALHDAGHQILCVDSAREGVALGRRVQPDVAIVELTLRDADGVTVLRSLRQSSPHTKVVMVTASGTTQSAVAAMRQGATDYLEKPIDVARVLQLVSRVKPIARTPLNGGAAPEPTMHAIARWVEIVLKTIDLPQDPKTVALWAHLTAASAGAIRAWCRAAHLPVKGSLNFARMLRVVMRFDECGRVSELLNVVDSRTLIAFLRLGCETAPPCQLPLPLDEFFERQRWIVDPVVIGHVRRALEARADRAGRPTIRRGGDASGPMPLRAGL